MLGPVVSLLEVVRATVLLSAVLESIVIASSTGDVGATVLLSVVLGSVVISSIGKVKGMLQDLLTKSALSFPIF